MSTLYASVSDKSAMVYLGDEISYPIIGVHDYIIVDPKKTNVYTHGFDVYNEKIYARVVVDEVSSIDTFLEHLLDLKHQGFANFFFDLQKPVDPQSFTNFLNRFKTDCSFKNTKIILHADDYKILENALVYVDALLLYNGLKDQDLHAKIKLYKTASKDIIDVETTNSTDIKQIEKLGLIPYVAPGSLKSYGSSSKNALKREILTLIDESIDDRMELPAHRYGAIALEYTGYIQKLHNIRTGLPNPEDTTQYGGVIVWLSVNYNNPPKLIEWLKEIRSKNIPIVFAYDFGFETADIYLQQLGIHTYDAEPATKKTITVKDSMMDFEIQVPITQDTLYLKAPLNSQELLTYTDSNDLSSTTAAITPWGGYALGSSFFVEIDGENLWSINPFEFFKKALRLQEFPVPDTTTQNGSRLFFSHIDGDGILNGVEFNSELVSGDIIYSEILKKYHVPHSVSVIGAEIMPNGLYPEHSQRLLELSKKIYALDNVEPATHTFTHPFFWGKIHNNNLDESYRLKPLGYDFSLNYELTEMLSFIQTNLLEQNSNKKAQSVYWSGDCNPRVDALELLAKHSFLNINGGDTTISNVHPWLTRIAPLGVERGGYYQIYTGAQNENVFTNDWLGPFWGFKKVVQTFKLTNSPKRLKPIDVYYHLYSGSKKASLNALRYVFDWVLQQNTMPIFTSEYIPKVMDYYTVSIAKDENASWLYAGMKDLKTLRVEKKNGGVALQNSPTTLGIQHFEEHTYIALDQHSKHLLQLQQAQSSDQVYLQRANGKVEEYLNTQGHKVYKFSSHVPLELEFYVPKKCTLSSMPQSTLNVSDHNKIKLQYQSSKRVTIDVRCK